METKTIQQDLADLFAGLAKESNSVQQPSVAPVEVPPVQTPAVTEPLVQAPVSTPNVAPTPIASPNVTPATPAPTASPDVLGVVDGWDASAPTPVVAPVVAPVPTPAVDFSDLAKVLGQEVRTKEDLVSVVAAVKAKADELSTLPENLSKAIEIARLGGNYLEYLGVSAIDWGKEDPVTLYENHVINQFSDRDGKVDYDKVDRILDKIDDDEKELRGRDLQRQYIAIQSQSKHQAEAQARAQRSAFEQSVRRTVDGLSEISGFKLSQSHKEDLYSSIVKGEDLRPTDVSQRVFNLFVTKYFGKIDSFRKEQIKNAAKREILEQAQLPELTAPSEVTPATADRGYNLGDFLKELENKKKW